MMIVDNDTLKDLLVEPEHVSGRDFEAAVEEAEGKNGDTSDILIEKGLIQERQMAQLLANYLGVRFADLSKMKIDHALLDLIPEVVARNRGVIVFGREGGRIKLGMTNPRDVRMKHFIAKKTGEEVEPYLITRKGLEDTLREYKPGLREEFMKIMKKLHDPELSKEERDETTIEIIDALVVYGHENQASDIHIEPHSSTVVVRFRIDGIMHEVLEIPKELYELLLTRIKILTKMRTDEHAAAQDGKFRFETDRETVDVRVSVVPVTEGENVVMRLLSARARQFNLSDLGLAQRDLSHVRSAIKHPHGMMLVTGPTGSGKTTTLYAVLKILNTPEVHIATIEDPVEYNIEGVSQIQVNPRTNLTFAKGLRAIVRQDPDIIMVGEIRDEETADIAVNSAMTGHLVLSTLHANDAATTLPRLLDMGIEPFLVASTVNIVIAQRLVRKICERCRESATLTEDEIKMIEDDPTLKGAFARKNKNYRTAIVFRGAGCAVCGKTGYAGRIGIFEILEMTPTIKRLIVNRASSAEIMKTAHEEGMTTMLEDGIQKVLLGQTTVAEVLRVTRE